MHAPRPGWRPEQARRFGERMRGAIGWLPGAATLGNVLAGYASILMAADGRYLLAAYLILGAAILDGIDGRLARMTGTESEFGEELDSLADAISFAVAPSILAFHMGVGSLGRVGWAVAFLFAACGVIRLARFNVGAHDHRFFIGLPIPTAAASITVPALITEGARIPAHLVPFHAGLMAVIAVLMVSRVRFRSFKDLRFGAKPYRALALWASILAGLLAKLEWVLPGLIALYLVSPIVFRLARGRAGRTIVAGPDGGGE